MKELPLNEIIQGDSAVLIKSIPDDSIDLVITSPPYYQQRNYSGGGIGDESTPEEYVDVLMNIFRECVRVIKPTGSIVFNLGDKYKKGSLLLMPYRFALTAIEQYDVMLVNNITWVKSNPTPRQFKRRLINSTEPFFHFVKSKVYKYYRDEFLKSEEKEKDKEKHVKVGKNIGKGYYSLIGKSELTQEQKDMAKEALNKVIEEVKSGEIKRFTMSIKGIHPYPYGGQDGGRLRQIDNYGFTIIRRQFNPIKRDVIIAGIGGYTGYQHPAVYPIKIVDEFIKLLTDKGDVVLDPFIGSGTTAISAIQQGRYYIGFDISDEYCRIARQRLSDVKQQLTL